MKIKNIEFRNNLILAPMADVTDVAFRSVAIECGADAGVTELISAKAITYNNKKTFDLMHTMDNEKIKIIQLFGNDPEVFAKAITNKHVQKFDIIDINMGCPAPKIVKNGCGGALMKDMDLAEKIIRKCVSVTDKPITVKFRSGWDKDHCNAVEFAKMCARAGASAITIHARFVTDGYSGTADYDVIKAVKESVDIPVIGNGDVVDKSTYEHMLNYTHCDAVMIGRASMGRPYIFAEILNKKHSTNVLDYINKHIEILKRYFPKEFITKHMRKHILWYLKGFRNASKIKTEVVTLKDIDDVIARLNEFFKDEI